MSGIFNKIDDIERVPWSKMTIEERLEKLNDFLKNKNIPEDVKNMLIEKINNGELKLKKEIDYDEINKKIKKIYFLIFDKNKNCYTYNTKKINPAELSRKSAIHKLFRK